MSFLECLVKRKKVAVIFFILRKRRPNVEEIDEALSTNIFNVMLSRRSQRKFDNRQVETSKVEMVYAAADTAPTAGGFQGFEIYHVRRAEMKVELVDAANKQPYVNAPSSWSFV